MAMKNNQDFFYAIRIYEYNGESRIFKTSKHHPDRTFKVYNQDGSWFITVYPGAYRLIFANPTAYLEGTDKQILCSGSDVTEGVLLVKPGRVVQKDGNFFIGLYH